MRFHSGRGYLTLRHTKCPYATFKKILLCLVRIRYDAMYLNVGCEVTYVILCCRQVKTPDVRNQRLGRNSFHLAVFCVWMSTSFLNPVDTIFYTVEKNTREAGNFFHK